MASPSLPPARYSGAGSVPLGMRWQVVSFFIGVVVVGRFFVLNLFIAVLLSNVSEVKDEKKAAQRRRKVRAMHASALGRASLSTHTHAPGCVLAPTQHRLCARAHLLRATPASRRA